MFVVISVVVVEIKMVMMIDFRSVFMLDEVTVEVIAMLILRKCVGGSSTSSVDHVHAPIYATESKNIPH